MEDEYKNDTIASSKVASQHCLPYEWDYAAAGKYLYHFRFFRHSTQSVKQLPVYHIATPNAMKYSVRKKAHMPTLLKECATNLWKRLVY